MQHCTFVSEEVIREAEARRPGILEVLAVVAGADVIGHVDAAGHQAVRPRLARVVRIVGIQRIDKRLRGHEVGVGLRVFVVVTHADVEHQLVVHRPVVLQVDAILLGRRFHHRHLARIIERTDVAHLEWHGRNTVLADLITELRVERAGLARGQLDVAVGHPVLMVCSPCHSSALKVRSFWNDQPFWLRNLKSSPLAAPVLRNTHWRGSASVRST